MPRFDVSLCAGMLTELEGLTILVRFEFTKILIWHLFVDSRLFVWIVRRDVVHRHCEAKFGSNTVGESTILENYCSAQGVEMKDEDESLRCPLG
jgi:hypothetical protein